MWLPGSNRFDRSTLFGEANYRRVLGNPRPPQAIWYYGHESSGALEHIDEYIPLWKQLIAEFQQETGPVPVIFAQVAKSTNAVWQEHNFRVAEQQRRSEAGQPEGTPGHFMVVTFDLPLGDIIHLSGGANRILGRRYALAMREHVLGEAVNGTGPRLKSVAQFRGNWRTIRVQFDCAITEPVNGYEDQFAVRDEHGEVPVVAVWRDSTGTSVMIQVDRSDDSPLWVEYGGGRAEDAGVFLTNVVRDLDGLPAPAFGPLRVE